ncbi:MAG: hypothetical protein FWD36_06325 [Treponema sp.]|nr:hypothetical protein [Treponema sp.]
MKNTKMKAMVRIAGLIALVAVIGFSMAACKDGGDDGGEKNPPIVGSWGSVVGVFTFNNDGTATMVAHDSTIINYTWSISGNEITTITVPAGFSETREFSISGNILTYKSTTWTRQ